MKHYSLSTRVASFIFLGCSLLMCTKKDQLATLENEPGGIEKKFFTTNRTQNDDEKVLVDYLIRQHQKNKFVEKTVAQIGYPRWDKMITVRKKGNGSGKGASDSTGTTYYIPFVRDTQQYVNASMIINTTASDTSFGYRCDWEYQNKVHGSPEVDTTAEGHAVFFMFFDNITFGYTDFSITDSDLFAAPTTAGGGQKKLTILSSANTPTGRGNTAGTQTGCMLWGNFFVCGTPDNAACMGPAGCDYRNCPNGKCYLYYGCVMWNQISLPVGGSGPTVGTGGGGSVGAGGGGNTGGGTPPPCPGTTSSQKGQTAVYGCGPGWSALGGPGTLPQDPCITAQNAAKQMDSIFIRSKADSVLNSIPNWVSLNEEKGFPIYKKYSINPHNVSDTTTIGYRCGDVQPGNATNMTITLAPKRLEASVSTLHIHPDTGYAAHSPADVYSLIDCRINDTEGQGHHFLGTFVASSNGSQYGLTITNPVQATAFFATKNQYLDADSVKWKKDSDIGRAFLVAKKYFDDLYESYPDNIHLSYEKAMAAVLNEFSTGVTLNKKDMSGSFTPIMVKTSPHPTKPSKRIYTQECQ
jgi:hypothetical protein